MLKRYDFICSNIFYDDELKVLSNCHKTPAANEQSNYTRRPFELPARRSAVLRTNFLFLIVCLYVLAQKRRVVIRRQIRTAEATERVMHRIAQVALTGAHLMRKQWRQLPVAVQLLSGARKKRLEVTESAQVVAVFRKPLLCHFRCLFLLTAAQRETAA